MAALAQQPILTTPPQELPNAVAMPSARCKALRELRALPRALMGGTKAMREAGETYLPRQPAEDQDDYQVRLASTILFGAFQQAVVRQAGKFFVEPLTLNDDVPPAIKELADNIDGQGRDITAFLVDLAREAFVDGVAYILTDYPQTPVGATAADVKASGSRPYWVLTRADDVLGWRTEMRGGKQILTQVRIREVATEPLRDFSERRVERVRVLEPGSWRIFEKPTGADGSRWVQIAQGTSSLPYVPLVPFYTNRTGYMEGEPPLRSLAELSLEHWQSTSEQRRALTFLRFAMLCLTGVEDGTSVKVGPNKVITLPVGGSANYVEHTGAGITSGFQDLAEIEKRMQSSGMELRVENSGTVTATAAAIDSNESNAALKAVARGLEDAVEQGLQMLAELLGASDGGTAKVYDDFGDPSSTADVPALTTLRASGDLSRMTLWAELKRRHFLDESFDPDAETALIENDQAEYLANIAKMNKVTEPSNPPPPTTPRKK